jgi:hypothetical protein
MTIMRDRIRSADQIETSVSPLPRSTLTQDSGAENVMVDSNLIHRYLSKSAAPDVLSKSDCPVDTNIHAVTPEPRGLDSDAGWVAMQKWQDQTLIHKVSGLPLFRLWKTDPHRDEVEEADWKGFLELLRKSYARRADTILWSMIVFIFAGIFLISVLGFLLGPTFAVLVALCWTAVHRVRRL